MHDSNRPRLFDALFVGLALVVLLGIGFVHSSYDSALQAAQEEGAVLERECARWQARHVRRGIAFPHGAEVEPQVVELNESEEFTSGG